MSVRTTTAPAPTLAERLDAARQAEAAPHQRAAELESALTAAVERRDFGEAERLEAELQVSKEQAALAGAVTRALAEGAAAIDREHADRLRVMQMAKQADEATRVINDATAADARAQDGIQDALARAYASIAAAQDAFSEATSWERKSGEERQRIANAQALLTGEQYPARASRPNAASYLIEADPAIRALMSWRRR